MRLTCPNCGARYEVDDTMIPAEGRDVQCSNCATTWFQPGPRSLAEDSGEEAGAPAGGTAEIETTEETDSPELNAADLETAEDLDDAAAPTRRELDPSVRDLLREEAEREARLRRGEPETVETQEEMALPEAEPDPETDADENDSGAREPEDVDENFDTDIDRDAISAAVAGSARRDLLPDIEEINSTLRATSDRSASEEVATDIETVEFAPRRRQGMRVGFGLVLLIAAGLVVLYVYAGALAETLPQAGPALDRYVGSVDALRLWLDTLAQGILQGNVDAPAPGQ